MHLTKLLPAGQNLIYTATGHVGFKNWCRVSFTMASCSVSAPSFALDSNEVFCVELSYQYMYVWHSVFSVAALQVYMLPKDFVIWSLDYFINSLIFLPTE